jgi:RHS repeat-associated protein
MSAGTYTLTAQATDDLGVTTTSAPVTVTITEPNSNPQAGMYFISADHLGTPRLIQDQNQQSVWTWDNTEAFGDSTPNQNPNGAGQFTYNPRFPGQYADVETETSYNNMRDYDSSIGGYIESDPLGLKGGLGTYGYVSGNPLLLVDFNGLSGCTFVGGLIVCDFGTSKPPLIDPRTGEMSVPHASSGSSKSSCPTCDDPEYKKYIKCDRLYDYPYTSMFQARMSGLGGGKLQKPRPAERGPCGQDSGFVVGTHWNVYDHGFVGTITSCECCRDVAGSGPKIETRYRVF